MFRIGALSGHEKSSFIEELQYVIYLSQYPPLNGGIQPKKSFIITKYLFSSHFMHLLLDLSNIYPGIHELHIPPTSLFEYGSHS